MTPSEAKAILGPLWPVGLALFLLGLWLAEEEDLGAKSGKGTTPYR